jgi:hypothetical protein
MHEMILNVSCYSRTGNKSIGASLGVVCRRRKRDRDFI